MRRLPWLLGLGLVVTSLVGITYTAASVLAQVSNPGNQVQITALTPPTSLTATPSGRDVVLGWGAGSNGNGYGIYGVANGASSDCSAASVASVGTSTGTSYTDALRFAPQGTYFCYEARTTFASWTSLSGNPRAAARIGVVATSMVLSNGGTADRLDTGDQIVITFNQAINPASQVAGRTVCQYSGTGTILLGVVSTKNACAATEAVSLGKILGRTTSFNARFAATWVWSAANTTLTVTIDRLLTGSPGASTGTASFGPTATATSMLSTVGGFHVCDTNAGGGACLPAATGSF